MTRTLAFLTLAIASTAAVAAGHLQPGYPACTSQDLLMQFESALVQKDEKAIEYLADNGCTPTIAFSHADASFIDQPTTGMARVRVYMKDKAYVVFTPIEAFIQK